MNQQEEHKSAAAQLADDERRFILEGNDFELEKTYLKRDIRRQQTTMFTGPIFSFLAVLLLLKIIPGKLIFMTVHGHSFAILAALLTALAYFAVSYGFLRFKRGLLAGMEKGRPLTKKDRSRNRLTNSQLIVFLNLVLMFGIASVSQMGVTKAAEPGQQSDQLPFIVLDEETSKGSETVVKTWKDLFTKEEFEVLQRSVPEEGEEESSEAEAAHTLLSYNYYKMNSVGLADKLYLAVREDLDKLPVRPDEAGYVKPGEAADNHAEEAAMKVSWTDEAKGEHERQTTRTAELQHGGSRLYVLLQIEDKVLVGTYQGAENPAEILKRLTEAVKNR